MRKTLLLIIALFCLTYNVVAQNWDTVKTSGKYYYGEGFGESVEEAKNMALSALTGMIATNVSSDFKHLADEKTSNGEVDHQSQVLNCIKSYSQATLTNVKEWVVSKHLRNALCVVIWSVPRWNGYSRAAYLKQKSI